jgi:GT2 family glycosyltransferase
MISIVIPTWNGCALMCDCLRSLRDQTFQDFEVIVVDDGSTDGTVMKLEEDCPEAQCVSLTQNRGFAVATNTGIRRATGTWVFLLNNDMTLEPECLARLMAGATDDVSMVAPLVLWRDEREVVYSAGDLMRTSGRPESHGFRVARADLKVPEEIFGVSAGAGLFRKGLFDEIGLLDESFAAYFEDSDLCFRARLAGHNAALAVDAVAYHIGSASIAGRTWWRTRQCFQNHGLLVIKNMPLALVLRHGPAIAGERFHQAGRLFSAARAEKGTLWACWIFACSVARLKLRIPRALFARFGTRRKIGIAELDRLLTR